MQKISVTKDKIKRFTTIGKKKALRLSYRIITFLGLDPAIEFSACSRNKLVGGKTGGVCVTPEMHTRELRSAGIDATLLVPKPAVTNLPKNHFYSFIKSRIPLDYSVEQLLQEPDLLNEVSDKLKGYDIIKVNHGLAASIILALKRRGDIQHKMKIIYGDIMWGRNISHLRVLSRKRDLIEREILQTADKIVVYTHAEKELIKKNYSDVVDTEVIDKKIIIIPLGVNTEEVNFKIRQRYRKRLRKYYLQNLSDSVNFFMLARLDELKNQKEAIMAFCKVIRENPNLNLSLSLFGDIGHGAKSKKYYDKICKYMNRQPKYVKSRVKFHGTRPTIHALAVGDVFLGPSLSEMWYLAANEAMACSIPTILSDTKIMQEIYGDGCCFVDPHNVDSIKNAIKKMATDNEFRQKVGAYSYQHTKNYTWKNSAKHLRQVFDEAILTKNFTLTDKNYTDITHSMSNYA